MSWPQPNRGPCRQGRVLDVREREEGREREGEESEGEERDWLLSSLPAGIIHWVKICLWRVKVHITTFFLFQLTVTITSWRFAILYTIQHKRYKTTSKIIYNNHSRVAQWERAGPITQRSMDRNHPLLIFFFHLTISLDPLRCMSLSQIFVLVL